VRAHPALAAGAAILIAVSAFLVGRWSSPTPSSALAPAASGSARGETQSVRERVVLAALSDHFERTERALVEIANADAADPVDITAERAWARDLLEANRLYRQSAQGAALPALAELLGEVEPILLEIVNSPDRLGPEDARALQSRIEHRSLVFKLRMTGAQMRERQRSSLTGGVPTS